MASPGTWQAVHTDAGYHLRLRGANGEDVVWDENHPDKRDVDNALQVVIASVTGREIFGIKIVDGVFHLGDTVVRLEQVDERSTT